jgi:hypothetical protein
LRLGGAREGGDGCECWYTAGVGGEAARQQRPVARRRHEGTAHLGLAPGALLGSEEVVHLACLLLLLQTQQFRTRGPRIGRRCLFSISLEMICGQPSGRRAVEESEARIACAPSAAQQTKGKGAWHGQPERKEAAGEADEAPWISTLPIACRRLSVAAVPAPITPQPSSAVSPPLHSCSASRTRVRTRARKALHARRHAQGARRRVLT